MGSGYRLFYFVEVIAFMIFLDFKVLYDMKDFKVLFVLGSEVGGSELEEFLLSCH